MIIGNLPNDIKLIDLYDHLHSKYIRTVKICKYIDEPYAPYTVRCNFTYNNALPKHKQDRFYAKFYEILNNWCAKNDLSYILHYGTGDYNDNEYIYIELSEKEYCSVQGCYQHSAVFITHRGQFLSFCSIHQISDYDLDEEQEEISEISLIESDSE